MTRSAGVPVVRLSARGTARWHRGHPWIFSADVAGTEARAPGAVQVADERGRALGSALFAPPPAPIALRAYARGGGFVPFDRALVAERLARAIARRRAIYGAAIDQARGRASERGGGRDTSIDVCRLVHAEADLLPGLFVDRWGDAAVVQSGTGAVDPFEGTIATELMAQLPGLRLVIARDDGSMRDHEALPRAKRVLAGGGPTLVQVREGAATLELDLMEDAKTGGFLDQRENHARAGEIAHGETLDAFTYHGGFALAMAPRAASVLAIDEDPRAAERARKNATLSGYRNVEVRAADASAVLRDFEREGRTFDVVVVDPPAIAKRKGPLEQALRAYKELNLRALRITKRDGWLVTCSCSGKVTAAHFGDMLEAAARDAKREVAVVERRSAGRDHPLLLGVPETDYLKCWFMQVL